LGDGVSGRGGNREEEGDGNREEGGWRGGMEGGVRRGGEIRLHCHIVKEKEREILRQMGVKLRDNRKDPSGESKIKRKDFS